MNRFGSKAGGTGLYVLLGLVAVGVFLAFMLMSFHNVEVQQRNLLIAKQKDNTSEFDNMRKKLAGVSSIPDAQFEKLKEVFTSYADARTGNGDNGSLMKWVQESIPNIDKASEIYTSVMNIVVASRDSWTMRQKELLDIQRVHSNILDIGFRGLILTKVFHRQKIDVTIITSANTKDVFRTGEDNDDGTLFKRKPVPVADKPVEK